MPLVPLDPRTALVLLGVVYLMMSGLVWSLLRRLHGGVVTALWCGGGVALGITYLAFSLRGAVPEWISVPIPNLMGLVGLSLRVEALRMERGHSEHGSWTTLAMFLALAISMVTYWMDESVRRPINVGLLMLGSMWLAAEARWLAMAVSSRAALLISGSYAFLAITLAIRLVTATMGLTVAPVMSPKLDLIGVLAGGLAAGLFGNVGYIGLALESLQSRREAQTRALALEQAQRASVEAQATALQERLAERDEFVRVLAHEVRQPLNNASAALQGARAAMQDDVLDNRAQADARLQRAQGVITDIVGSIDNTLAATKLLASSQPLMPRDADVNVLIELSLGDLGPVQRARVHVEETDHARTVAMDIGLMRLALRNLLANALAYSPPESAVTLAVMDTDEPLGLAFEVRDEGPGISAPLQQRLFDRGARGEHGLPGHGLGLHVVRQIMLRHGGQASWTPNVPSGSVFRLWLPIVE